VPKHVLCSLMNISDVFDMVMFNSVIIEKNEKLIAIDRKCTSVGTIPNHFVLQFWSVVSTTNGLPLVFCTNAYFVVPDITFLAAFSVIFFFFCIWQCNNLSRKITPVIFADDLFVTMNLSYTLLRVRLLGPLVIRLVIVGKRHNLFWVSSRLWSEIRWQTNIIKSNVAIR